MQSIKNTLIIFFQKKNFFDLYIIFCLITSWTAIGINPGNLFNLDLRDKLYFFRGTIPLLNFLILLYFIFIKKKYFPIVNIYFLLFTFYFISQFIGLIYSKNNNYLDLYYLINCFNVLSASCFAFHKKKVELKNLLFYILFIFISINFIYFFFINFIIFLKIPYSIYMGWGHVVDKYSNISNINFYLPNVLGISRNGLILFLILFLFSETKKGGIYLITVITLIIIAACLLLLQSRATILIYCLFLFFYFVFFIKKKFLNFFKYILIFFLMPILLFFLINYVKIDNLSIENKKVIENLKNNSKNANDQYWLNQPFYLRNLPKGNFSSDRIEDWKNLINLSKKSFFGFGPQGDRQVYKKTASNGTLYAFVCSGYIGLIIFISICILSIYHSLIFIVKNKLNKNKNNFFSAFVILFLIFRSIFESSFAVFGIDYIIFVYAIFYVQYSLFYKKL